MDDASWAALTLSLTVLGGIWTWYAFRRRGLASGIRGIGLTLLPLAAYLTNTLRMFTRIVDAVGDWIATLVLSPKVWVGIVVAGVAVVAFVAARALEARSGGRPVERAGRRTPKAAVGSAERGAPAVQDDDLADIEALLRKRGIS
ncbi:MAG TPA: hypothetical protein VMF51_07675 [Nocardioides sp.]|uniref:hypothetical protein n=1 Tax=Nocardioides sp. TaxID=35761 RepID=UPI002BE1263F|nr:hypothetical protein [Nocardioides sp.]HTW14992.1 hypothetical protein [Nocardioides sp.]